MATDEHLLPANVLTNPLNDLQDNISLGQFAAHVQRALEYSHERVVDEVQPIDR
jgi:hypothetical protein